MARPISDEELQLKKRARRRLVGAIVLVSVLAVVLPMVLDSEPKPAGQKVDIQIPSPDAGEFKPQATPPSGAAKPAPELAAKADPAASTPKPDSAAPATERASAVPSGPDTAAAPANTLPADRPQEAAPAKGSTKAPAPKTEAKSTSPKSETKSAASARSDGAVPGGAYVVQVAALADAGKAKDLEKRMANAGLKTYTEVVTTQAGEVTRVRAGPYATREAAEKARAQLKKAGIDGKIVPR